MHKGIVPPGFEGDGLDLTPDVRGVMAWVGWDGWIGRSVEFVCCESKCPILNGTYLLQHSDIDIGTPIPLPPPTLRHPPAHHPYPSTPSTSSTNLFSIPNTLLTCVNPRRAFFRLANNCAVLSTFLISLPFILNLAKASKSASVNSCS